MNKLLEAAGEMCTRDWMDLESVVKRQDHLDTDYVLGPIEDFGGLSDDPDLSERVKRRLGGVE